jgi:sugar O-acyltransferase (sialic acid O-acetyltransferase NeuD family)
VYEVHETLRRLGWVVRGLVANVSGAPRPDDLGQVVDVAGIPPAWIDLPAVFPLVTPGHRRHLEREARALGFRTFPAIVDPTTAVAGSATVGEGTVINAGGVIGANSRIGRFGLVNRSASVGHDADVGDYASLGPACVLCGEVRIARGAFVGAGAVILPQVSVGANAVVGAGAVVVQDVPGNAVVVGNPARVTRTGNPGHNGVSVDDEDLGVSA